ncbi:50S ribosomal protein L17 [Candidatus Curtissbacteria bacterium RIFCSPLOWO2_01_FULL_39_62]|uniref:50S ribosomal protein L17 n=2 Tax=Candidatus Curtissiibacteriota TaxID=1752717 RepID=A0A1F5G7K8_9BACT|nr:MAG: 50S ribosomal protein L17 [Candidatus Curtissbacteria bacterium RIFCSPHIGHO2_01_FULL_39_57]OGD87805.1 MAG: 50S ribosomal protein L17 [Candidatus Curtissbacteria bacterium RIFCSPHIGHO2_02_FULL_40_16b]OGD90558.1 MAG: 50S ribosomal protein L17 [Candidatus Curtissbacteria bacterium RIFCSPHIGHO2_12_FULL_38_37]OGD99825.1 MAG: 50S ribosomal protein L17 [Candidatus Curtissbacteria bacterium RIFCSPLOWO2_02_FULL_40_11]OGE01069.1 MAG: 50S ribosomal protein L17 [Candidatus Curtissbacteria bacterium
MRHAVFGQKLSRDTKARKALLNNLASSLIIHGHLRTTLAKAKFSQGYIEKLVSQAKKNRLNRYRILASKLNHHAFIKLINEVGPGFENRKGGYTRVLKIPARRGDAAQMAKLEFLEWDKTKAKTPKQTTKKANTKTKSVKETKTTAKPQPNEKKVLNTKETKNEKRKT